MLQTISEDHISTILFKPSELTKNEIKLKYLIQYIFFLRDKLDSAILTRYFTSLSVWGQTKKAE